VTDVGAFIRRQRELQQLSIRRVADLAGISNPYLSQIENGLREPSERVLASIADSLGVPAAAIKDAAGLTPEDAESSPVVKAIQDDEGLTARQRRAMLEVYAAFTGRRH
jgi:transcriptional regulator with XRE-family HTH domain